MKSLLWYIGIDLFGAITVKQRQSRLKCLGVFFSCCNTRAFHLMIFEGLDIDSFIDSLRRFMNRRGLPEQASSDSRIDTNKLHEFSLDKGMTWNFNPQVSHMRGLWWNGVQIVKKIMFNVIKNAILTKFQLMIIYDNDHQ